MVPQQRDNSSATTAVCTGHNLVTITHGSFRQLWANHGVPPRQRDLSSGFMTVGDADTPLHPQFFGAITFRVPAIDPRQCHS